MHVEVDQSGKIGDTKVPTVLAFSNSESYAILIPATVKRDSLRALRQQGKSGTTLYLEVFAIGLYLLLKDHIRKFSLVTIDIEYPGHSDKIKEHLLYLLRRAEVSIEADQIRFALIYQGGKKPRAHDRAYYTYRGEMAPDRVITLEELLNEVK
ncbi:MAG: hypothetical protein ACE5LU_05925 [Anaerolineae bacterium]